MEIGRDWTLLRYPSWRQESTRLGVEDYTIEQIYYINRTFEKNIEFQDTKLWTSVCANSQVEKLGQGLYDFVQAYLNDIPMRKVMCLTCVACKIPSRLKFYETEIVESISA